MQLLNHLRITWEAFGIELLHLSREFRDLFRGPWVVFHHLPKLVHFSHPLLVAAFCIGKIG
jgi:hypothetical protein